MRNHRCSILTVDHEHYQTGRHYQTSSNISTSSSSSSSSETSNHTQAAHDPGSACWGCSAPLPRGNLVCSSCHRVQPVNNQLDYFDVMGMPPGNFDIETATLDTRYKALQWQLHPDLSAHKPASEKAYSAEQSMVVNMAYSVLRTPLSRANYMLTLQGIKAGDNAEGTIMDPELLMEVMDAREEVEATEDVRALRHILNGNRASQQVLLAELSRAFAQRQLTEVVTAVTKLTYLVRLEEEVVGKLPSLDGLSTVTPTPAAAATAEQARRHR
ncbi:MAG: hypothetical protein WDW36_001563 [Sanguina aurantia]